MSTFKPTISREQFTETLYQFAEGMEAFGRLYTAMDVLEGNVETATNLIDAAIDALIAHFDIKEKTDLHGYAFDLLFDISDESTWRTDFEATASNLYAQLVDLHDEQEEDANNE